MEKDLNLKIDRDWLAGISPEEQQNNGRQRPDREHALEEPSEQRPPRHAPAQDIPHTQKQPLLWLLTASHVVMVIALVMLLARAGATPEQSSAVPVAQSTDIPSESITTILEGQASLQTEIARLQKQMEQLELQLYEQREQTAIVHRDMEQSFITLQASLEKQPGAPAKSDKKANTLWSLNLGTFSSQEAARSLKEKISKLGYQATMNETTLGGKPAYRVQLPGFKSREAAEKVAGQLMNKTNLNGLWATRQTAP
ncbi:MAG: SPOR domain-containing protein [Porticoccaceae bacterium]